MIEKEFKNMISEAIHEEMESLRSEVRELRNILATERITNREACRILGFKDQRTAKKHLSKAGIEPIYDENGRPKYIKKDIIDYARNKDLKITA